MRAVLLGLLPPLLMTVFFVYETYDGHARFMAGQMLAHHIVAER